MVQLDLKSVSNWFLTPSQLYMSCDDDEDWHFVECSRYPRGKPCLWHTLEHSLCQVINKSTRACTHACTHTDASSHTHTCFTHTHTCAQPRTCTHTHTHTHTLQAHTHTQTYTCTTTYGERVHTHTHTYTPIHTDTHAHHTHTQKESGSADTTITDLKTGEPRAICSWGRQHSPYTLAHSCRMPTPQQRTVRSTERVQPRAKQQAACSGWSEASCPRSPCWSGRRCVARCVTTASGCGPCCSRRSPQSSAGWTCAGGWSLPARLMTLGTALWWIPLKKSKPGMGGLCSYRRVGMRHWLLFLPSLYSPMQTVLSFSDCMYSLFAAHGVDGAGIFGHMLWLDASADQTVLSFSGCMDSLFTMKKPNQNKTQSF